MGRKHCGKGINCLLRAISLFPSVLKRLILQTRKKSGIANKQVYATHYQISSLYQLLTVSV